MDKLKILEMIEKGEISPDEGARLITEENNTDQEDKSMDEEESEMHILENIEKGNLSIEEGINKLQDGTPIKKPIKPIKSNGKKSSGLSDEELKKWRNWWTIPLFIGFGIVISSGLWMNAIYENTGVSFWYIFSWIPLLFGIATMAFSWPSPNRTWLHVRVKQAKGETPKRIAISIPMPLNLISWGFKIAKKFIPDETMERIDVKAIEDMILGFGKSAENGTPFYVEVNEGDGERVEVYIG